MPELPEVETVRRGLADLVDGAQVASVEVRHPRAVRRDSAGADGVVAAVAGRVLGTADRRGKVLWLPLGEPGATAADAPACLVVALGMSGQVRVVDPAVPDGEHLRVRLGLADGRELRLVDQRTFGGVAVHPLVADPWTAGLRRVPGGQVHVAPDVLEDVTTTQRLRRGLRRRRTGLKRALLDQGLVYEVGNIYADEVLWTARLHPRRRTEGITAAEAGRLLDALREVMTAAVQVGGTSFDALYVSVNGESGRHGDALAVYGRAGLPCRRCGEVLVGDVVGGRSTVSCPTCQPRPARPHRP